jgi:hypothetical protein
MNPFNDAHRAGASPKRRLVSGMKMGNACFPFFIRSKIRAMRAWRYTANKSCASDALELMIRQCLQIP